MSFPTVIVVEDDLDLRDIMCTFLAIEGIDVRGVPDGPQLDRVWADRPADVLVLDVNLPGESGFAIAARMRVASRAGIIILTARAEAHDRIAGLECGADNYLVKPVELRELAAAVKGLARRLAADRQQAKPEPVWCFDLVNWTLVAPSGAEVALTTAEYCLLSRLVEEPGASVSSGDIMAALGKVAVETSRRSLDSVLSRLRRKVEEQAGLPLPVKAVRSVGYVFASPLVRR